MLSKFCDNAIFHSRGHLLQGQIELKETCADCEGVTDVIVVRVFRKDYWAEFVTSTLN